MSRKFLILLIPFFIFGCVSRPPKLGTRESLVIPSRFPAAEESKFSITVHDDSRQYEKTLLDGLQNLNTVFKEQGCAFYGLFDLKFKDGGNVLPDEAASMSGYASCEQGQLSFEVECKNARNIFADTRSRIQIKDSQGRIIDQRFFQGLNKTDESNW